MVFELVVAVLSLFELVVAVLSLGVLCARAPAVESAKSDAANRIEDGILAIVEFP
jgi:hypothetical protein